MGLSEEFVAQLRDEVQPALRDHYQRRVAQVNRDARNLEEYGAPISELGALSTDAAAEEALSILENIGAAVVT